MKEIAHLEQRKFSKGKQSFVLNEDGTLHVTTSKGESFQHFSIDLAGWSPDPVHAKNNPIIHRIFLILFAAVLALYVLGGTLFALFALPDMPDTTLPAIIGPTVIFGILWLIVFNQYQLRNYDHLVFSNTTTGAFLVLFNNLPSANEFSAFVETLKATIKKYPKPAFPNAQSTTADLREFARLRDDGILTIDEYEEVKRKLLSDIKAPSTIGFHP